MPDFESIELTPGNFKRTSATIYNETNQSLTIVATPMIDRIDSALQSLEQHIDNAVADWVYFQNGNPDKVIEVLRERHRELADAVSALRGSKPE